MSKTEFIFWMITSFLGGGIAGGLTVARFCGKEYKERIKSAVEERDEMYRELSDCRKKYDGLLNDKTKELEVLSEKYDNTDFDKHFSERVAPSDDDEDIRFYTSEKEFHQTYGLENERTVTYYSRDGVLADEEDKLIDNADDLLGSDCLEYLSDSEDKAVYVRNEDLDENFEVIIEPSLSYYRDILGE